METIEGYYKDKLHWLKEEFRIFKGREPTKKELIEYYKEKEQKEGREVKAERPATTEEIRNQYEEEVNAVADNLYEEELINYNKELQKYNIYEKALTKALTPREPIYTSRDLAELKRREARKAERLLKYQSGLLSEKQFRARELAASRGKPITPIGYRDGEYDDLERALNLFYEEPDKPIRMLTVMELIAENHLWLLPLTETDITRKRAGAYSNFRLSKYGQLLVKTALKNINYILHENQVKLCADVLAVFLSEAMGRLSYFVVDESGNEIAEQRGIIEIAAVNAYRAFTTRTIQLPKSNILFNDPEEVRVFSQEYRDDIFKNIMDVISIDTIHKDRSDKFIEVQEHLVIMQDVTIYFIENAVFGGAANKSYSVDTYNNDITGSLICRNYKTAAGYCLLTAIQRLTNFVLPLNDKGKPVLIKAWAKLLNMIPTTSTLSLLCVDQLEDIVKVCLTVIDCLTGEVLRHGNMDYPQPLEGRAIGYDKDKKHYNVIVSGERKKQLMLMNEEVKEVREKKKPQAWLFYDIETINVEKAGTSTYAVAACIFETLNDALPLPKNPEEFKEAIKEDRAFYLAMEPHEGENALYCFAHWVMKSKIACKYNLNIAAYNGAKFDHLQLINVMQERDFISESSLILGGGNKVLNCKIRGGHKFVDPLLYISGPLSANCEAFKCSRKKIGDFGHEAPQEAYNANVLGQWINDNEEKLYDYNVMDVLAGGELCILLGDALKSISSQVCNEPLIYTDYLTASSFSMKLLKNIISDCKDSYPVAPKTYKMDKWFRGSLFAGRAQNMSGKPTKITGKMQQLDIVSSYPNVLYREEFPEGDYIETDTYVKDCLGVYEVNIISQPKLTIVPLRVKDKPLNWAYTGSHQAVLNSIDIEEIIKHGGEIEIMNGVYWPTKSRRCFKPYIEKLYILKAQQDTYNKEKNPAYNPALRECVKLLLNGISGKVGQRQINDMLKICGNNADALAFIKSIDSDTLEVHNWTKTVLLKGKLDESQQEEKYDKQYKKGKCSPSYIAGMIYSYARRNLYKGLQYAGENSICDTDSVIISYERAQQMKEEHPELFTKEGCDKNLGEWEGELIQDGTREFDIYLIAPKEYAIFSKDDKPLYKKEMFKIRSKGVGKRDKYIGKRDSDEVKRLMSCTELERAEWETNNADKIFNTYDTAKKVYENAANNIASTFMCLQFRRCLGGRNIGNSRLGTSIVHTIKTVLGN